MGLLVECPDCKKRNSQKVKACKCGFALAKFSGRVWWLEYYDHFKMYNAVSRDELQSMVNEKSE